MTPSVLTMHLQSLDLRISQLRALAVIAAEGSLSAGARRLGVAQPTLTRAVQQLEVTLGSPVLARGPGGLTLTDFGRVLLPHAQRLLKAHEKAQEAACQLRGETRARLEVAASALPRLVLLPAASRTLWSAYPDAQLLLSEAAYPHVLARFETGTLDFALCPVPLDRVPDAYEARELFTVELAVTLRADHPLRHARSLADLAHAEWVAAGPPFGQGLPDAFVNNGLQPPPCPVHCESLEHALGLVAQTAMLTLAPLSVVRQLPMAQTLCQLPLRDCMPTLTIALLLPRQRALSPAAQTLLSAIEAGALAWREAPI
jgi:LysR family transcriptional regulator, regulator of abg operon